MVYGGVIKRLSLQRLRLLLKITFSLSFMCLHLWGFDTSFKTLLIEFPSLFFTSMDEKNKSIRTARNTCSSKI